MLQIPTYVAASKIEGLGVFAAEPIAVGTVIWRFHELFDRRIPAATYDSLPKHMRDHLDRYAYPSPDLPGHVVYESDNARFMNHAEQPNSDFSGPDSGVATRDIAAGEEITCDYRQFHPDFRF